MMRQILKEYTYTPATIQRGYSGKSLYLNVSDLRMEEKVVTEFMKEKFIGGKGFDLWYLWQAVTPETRWDSPENEIVMSVGPLGGITQYSGTGKTLVCAISPMTGIPIDSNAGGYFGPLLKFSGWDALELQGKTEKELVIFIDGNKGLIQFCDAEGLPEDSHLLAEELTRNYAESEEDQVNVSVVSSGSAARNILYGMLNFSFYDPRRKVVRFKQAARGGLGTIMLDKGIKALVVRYKGIKGNTNNPADVATLNRIGVKYHKEMHDLDEKQNGMRKIGTANTILVMNQYDLLPTRNFQTGGDPAAVNISPKVFIEQYLTQGIHDGCWYGCTMSCAKTADHFRLLTGPYAGACVTVDGPEYECVAGLGSNLGIFDPRAILEENFYCDTYGVDLISFATTVAFIMECYQRGQISREQMGGLDLAFGNSDAVLELLHQMARGEGFGPIAGLGIRRLKKLFAEQFGSDPALLQDIGMENKGLEYSEYCHKESLAQQGGFALTNKGPQHDEAWLIFMDMVNNQIPTFEDKAYALYYYPMFRTWFGLCGLCKLPWNDIVPADNYKTETPAKVPEHVQNYVDIFNAVTGKSIDKEELILQSERVYQFQRVFNIRMGKGLREHDYAPYRSLGPVSSEEYLSRQELYDRQLREKQGLDPAAMSLDEKIATTRAYREQQFELLMDAVYKRRGWTENGVPKPEHLREIGMDLPMLLEVIEPHL
ncbi:MAG TPA: aldehyde ferredoxin oxidoreductase C-terminal domain-containing protein [Anaerolineaceae bacterium]|jgi:aldehyde:ferredoxin oxidoreductase|nr:aldehyde ferredoxin oxidoreductase C-terminal domain-containing protein [Anaerolineaceae bacterium]HPT24109.1 aldehyde ferredoxin oxidoreductase C-terminal domain-containing protein [Anaerolineaceae bacterium]